MTIINKIRKRIMTRKLMESRRISEIQITKKEAEQLGERTYIDNVKLIVVDKLGDMSNKDCFAYLGKDCYSLKELYCKNSECEFYRTDVAIPEIERSIRQYASKG